MVLGTPLETLRDTLECRGGGEEEDRTPDLAICAAVNCMVLQKVMGMATKVWSHFKTSSLPGSLTSMVNSSSTSGMAFTGMVTAAMSAAGSRCQILHRLIPASVSEAKLESRTTKSPAQQLVSKTNSESRHS